MSAGGGDDRVPAADGARAGSGLGTASLLLGIVAAAGSLLFALVAHGMSTESSGRSIEGAEDGSAEVLGAIGCVGGLFAVVALAGLVLGGMALGRAGAPRRPAVVGMALCVLWLVVAGVVASRAV